MSQPKVSVVIPVYNVEKYIRECLDSALAQTLKEIEIICVDDGSTDSCPAILDAYAEKDSRVKVIHKANGGYGMAMNVGMDTATGEYFAILESDDMIRPDMYETLYAVAKKKDLDIVKSDFYRFTVEDEVMLPSPSGISKSRDLYNMVIENDPVQVLQMSNIVTWCGLYRMAFLREKNIRHNETPGASYQDNGFWFLTMANAGRVWFHGEAFYMLRRDNPNSSIYNRSKVYCIPQEYEYILENLKKDRPLYQKVIGVYWRALFGNYMWTYQRIAAEFKSEFAGFFAAKMREAKAAGELDLALFSVNDERDLKLLLSDPRRFEVLKREKDPEYRAQQPYTALNRLKWCYEDNGLIYTIGHIFDRISGKS